MKLFYDACHGHVTCRYARSSPRVVCKFVTHVDRLRRVVVSLRGVSEIIFLDHVSCQFDRSLRDHDHGVVTQHVVTRECEFVMVTHVMGYSSCEVS